MSGRSFRLQVLSAAGKDSQAGNDFPRLPEPQDRLTRIEWFNRDTPVSVSFTITNLEDSMLARIS
jgi:hypothetical protein